MAAYKDLIGQKITVVTSNPPEPKTGQMWYNSTDGKLRGLGVVEAFSSAPNLPSIAFRRTGYGVQTAGVIAGGSSTSPNRLTTTEEYNGSGYSAGGTLTTGRRLSSGAGTQTAGLFYLGAGPSSDTDVTVLNEEYNGTSYSEVGDLTTARQGAAGDGTQTAAFAAAGSIAPGPTDVAETWNGTAWTNLPSVNTTRRFLSGSGNPSAAVIFGGEVNPSGPSDTRKATEEYNGSSWTTVTNMNSGAGTLASSGGSQTDLISFGGRRSTTVNNAEAYDGTTWSASPATLALARSMTSGLGSGTAALCATGETQPGPYTNVSEEYNKSTNTVTAAAWAAGGNLNTGRNAGSGFGIQTAAVMTTGNEPGETNATEEYDGSSWTSVTNYPISKRFTAASGTLTSGLVAGGSPAVATVNKYDGTNWTAANSLPTSTDGGVMFGTQAASVYSVGRNPSATTTTYEFDGTNWTAGGAAGTARYFLASSGTLTAGLMFGGQAPGPSIKSETEEYNGTSWSESGDLGTGRYGVGGSSAGTQTDTIAFAGNNPAVVLTEGYDGTVWSTRPNMATARRFISGAGTATLGIGFGGNPPNNSTEEFTGETLTGNVTDFSTE